MTSEKELLERVIKEKLGEGKAKYEVNVGFEGKRIDLVFEKENEIWLIEAKRRLNFEALGQVLTYKKLYEHEILSSKNIKLGIVCKETDVEVEEACKSERIEVFAFPEKIGEVTEEAPICGVCGSQMVEEGGEYKCKTCEYFFGMSSKIRKCSGCGVMYGSYPVVEATILNIPRVCVTKIAGEIATAYCPKCREKSERYFEIGRTFVDMLRMNMERGNFTPNAAVLYFQTLTYKSKEFIDYCLGRAKPFFGKETVAENKMRKGEFENVG